MPRIGSTACGGRFVIFEVCAVAWLFGDGELGGGGFGIAIVAGHIGMIIFVV